MSVVTCGTLRVYGRCAVSTRSRRAIELHRAAVHIENQIDQRQVKADGSCVSCGAQEYEDLKNAAEWAWDTYHDQVLQDENADENADDSMWDNENGMSNALCNLAMPLALVVFLVLVVVGLDVPIDWGYVPGLFGL